MNEINTVKATALRINQPCVILWQDRYDELIAKERQLDAARASKKKGRKRGR